MAFQKLDTWARTNSVNTSAAGEMPNLTRDGRALGASDSVVAAIIEAKIWERQSVHGSEKSKALCLEVTNADSTTALCSSCLVKLTFCLERVFGCLLAHIFVLLKVANGDIGHVCAIGTQRDLAGMEKLCEKHCDSIFPLSQAMSEMIGEVVKVVVQGSRRCCNQVA